MTISTDEDWPRGHRPGRFPSPNPLIPDAPALYFQTQFGEGHLEHAAELMNNEQVGTVLTLTQANYVSLLNSVLNDCRRVGVPVESMMLDASCYSGKARKLEPRLTKEWITRQRRAGLRVQLTDSPYIPSHGAATLSAVLAQAAGFGEGTVAVLPLELDWLTRQAEALVDAINREGVPVALVLEHTKDPLGVQRAVLGLTSLIDAAQVKVGVLRCDLSVIGAVAFGASWGAVGATSSLRHLYPLAKGGGPRYARVSALVPRSLSYRSLEMIAAGIAADPDNELPWRCDCRFCLGLTIEPIADAVSAYRHSLAAIALLGEQILMGDSVLQRKHSWVDACGQAQYVNLDIGSSTGMNWEPPAFQGAWWKLRAGLPPLTPVLV